MKQLVLLALGVCVGSGACGHAQAGTAAEPQTRAAEQAELSLGPGDTFDIRVFGEPDLTNTYRVGTDGTIDYPLLGPIKIEGMEPHALAVEIAHRLGEKYLKSPQVSILVRDQPSKKLTVIGQVNRPGTYPFQTNLNIFDAVALAGGFTPIAAKNKVTVKRVESGIEKVFELPVIDIGEGRAPNFRMRPGDMISVPERIF